MRPILRCTSAIAPECGDRSAGSRSVDESAGRRDYH
jgi:hypothetical protein